MDNKTTKPGKQRKREIKQPMHRRQKKMSVTLKPSLREEHGARRIPVRKGDKVKVTRGDEKNRTGEVTRVNLSKYTVQIEDIEKETQSGETAEKEFHPSNIMITKLNLEDEERKKILERKGEQND